MGGLLAVFGSDSLKDFELNWEDIKVAHPEDAAVYEKSKQVIETLDTMVEQMQNYEGCAPLIKRAIRADVDTDEQHDAIRAALIELGKRAADCLFWMQMCDHIGGFLRDELLPRLSSEVPSGESSPSADSSKGASAMSAAGDDEKKADGALSPASSLTILTHQALSKQVVIILEKFVSFDQAKMLKSQLQNDFAYYKRNLQKKGSPWLAGVEFPVGAAEAGNISMFLAYAIPSMRAIAAAIKDSSAATETLATVANACHDLLKAKKFPDGSTDHELAVRAMLSGFIMFDYASPIGAFTRRSTTKGAKICAMINSGYEAAYGSSTPVQGLKNIIVFSSLHYNDATTVAAIRRILD